MCIVEYKVFITSAVEEDNLFLSAERVTAVDLAEFGIEVHIEWRSMYQWIKDWIVLNSICKYCCFLQEQSKGTRVTGIAVITLIHVTLYLTL